MQINNNTLIKRKNKTFKEIDKKTFILNEKNDELLELNETATFIWNQLKTTAKFEDLINLITKTFDVAEKKAKTDLQKIIKLFKEKELIIIKNSSN